MTAPLASDLDSYLYSTGFTKSPAKGAGLLSSLRNKDCDF